MHGRSVFMAHDTSETGKKETRGNRRGNEKTKIGNENLARTLSFENLFRSRSVDDRRPTVTIATATTIKGDAQRYRWSQLCSAGMTTTTMTVVITVIVTIRLSNNSGGRHKESPRYHSESGLTGVGIGTRLDEGAFLSSVSFRCYRKTPFTLRTRRRDTGKYEEKYLLQKTVW